jgi:hypothetical protein
VTDDGAEAEAAGSRRAARAERSEEVATARSRPADHGKQSEASDKKASSSAARPASSSKSGASGEGKDLEDVLNQVTGGVTAPAEVEKEKARPSKKELDRRDVATAMTGVRVAVMKCRDLEQFEGTVTVKFVVDPSGKVSSVSSTRKGPTGDCVAAAVKRASFPAFDGAPTSFTYPFLLAE